MNLTGRLGTPDSQLGHVELAAPGSLATVQTIQARANIQNTTAQTIQAKANIQMPRFFIQARANIYNATSQTIQAKARLLPGPGNQQNISARARVQGGGVFSIQAKARITPGVKTISAKANLLAFVSTSLEVDYNVEIAVSQTVTVSYTVGVPFPTFQYVQAKANIVKPIKATLTVAYTVNYAMPTGFVVRPTQRSYVRTVRTISARARINNFRTVVLPEFGVFPPNTFNITP